MTLAITKRAVLTTGIERYPDSAPNTSSSHRQCNGGQPSLTVDDDGTYMAGFSSGTSHEGTNAVCAWLPSKDQGRSWGNIARDVQIIDVNPDITKRSLFSSWRKLKYGAKKGRIITVGARGDVIGQEQYDSYSWFSDPGTRGIQTIVKLPQVETYYTIGISVDQLPDTHPTHPCRVIVTMYTRRQGASGARSFTCYSDDYGVTYHLFDNSVINANPSSGASGVIASDPNFITEYKEPYGGALPDGTMMCLIRSDDSAQKIYISFSTDGEFWTTPVFAFDGYNFPAWCVSTTGIIYCTTRKKTGQPPDGNDCSTLWTSPDLGSTWVNTMDLWDPQLGTGSSVGCGPYPLPDGRVGVVITWCKPGVAQNAEIYTHWRLEYIELDPNPESPTEYGRYDWDANKVNPSSYVHNVVGWYPPEDLRLTPLLHGDTVSRWRNKQGDSRLDLVPGPNGGWIFQDGSDMTTPSPEGLLGGIGFATNHAGNRNMGWEHPLTFAQPFCVLVIADRATLISTFTLWDDGNGAAAKYQSSGGGQIFMQLNGTNVFFTMPVAPWVGCFTSVHDSTLPHGCTMRLNGTPLVYASGGPLGATSITGCRIGGAANACFFQSIAEIVIFQDSDLTRIAALEAALLAKHRVNG